MWPWFRRQPGWVQVAGWLLVLPLVVSVFVWSRRAWPAGIRVLAIGVIAIVTVGVLSSESGSKPAATTSASPPRDSTIPATSAGSISTPTSHHKKQRKHNAAPPKPAPTKPQHFHHPHRIRLALSLGVPVVDVPAHALTPGVALAVGVSQICQPGYASSVRDVPQSEKAAVYARYRVRWVPYQHEIDHLVSLEIGGSNSIRNLWPEPYAGRWGARTKDVLENKLHDLVCTGNWA